MKTIKFYNPDGSLIKERPLVHIDASKRFTTMYIIEEGIYRYLWDNVHIDNISVCGDTGIITVRYVNGNYLEIMKASNLQSTLNGYPS